MSAATNGKKRTAKPQDASDEAVSYDEFKDHEGRKYTGMKIGRGHTWNYDEGKWKEKKITPDLWQISYAVTKRRAGRAPEGSGVPVGTEYHWYVLAHQNVEKLNANDYTTSMTGLKFKIAHRRADSEKWSATPKTQRKRMIRFLRDVIADLEEQEAETATAKTTGESTKATESKKATASKQASRAKKTTESTKGSGAAGKRTAAKRSGASRTKTPARKKSAAGSTRRRRASSSTSSRTRAVRRSR
jgi:hypothetical protein